jgi:hypothetical protein
MERTLDRIPRFDTRSLNFVLADHFAMTTPLVTRRRLQWGLYLDQFQEGACVGFGTAKALGIAPKHWTVDNAMARALYFDAQRFDEWAGENYEGSSVLGAMQALRSDDRITAYYWATSVSQMQHAICSTLGPMVVGVNWYEGMFEPGPDGFVRVAGDVAGGHCVCLGGIDMERKAFVLHNSWGRYWGGVGGAQVSSAFLSFADMDRLLHEQGEAALMSKPLT